VVSEIINGLIEYFEVRLEIYDKIINFLKNNDNLEFINKMINLFKSESSIQRELLVSLKNSKFTELTLKFDDRGRIRIKRIFPKLFEVFPNRELLLYYTKKCLIIPLGGQDCKKMIEKPKKGEDIIK